MSRWPFQLAFAAVWLVSGLHFKVLGGRPQHEAIVGRIFGEARAGPLTRAIGWAEAAFGLWILSGLAWTLSCVLQVLAVAGMNLIELWRAPDLLRFGRWNAAVALLYCMAVAWAAGAFAAAPGAGGPLP